MAPETSLRRRLLLTASAAVLAVTLAALALVHLTIRNAGERAFEARLRQTAASLLSGLARGSDGTLSLDDRVAELPEFARPRSGWYWQAEQNGMIVLRSRSLGADMIQTGTASDATLHGERIITATAAKRESDGFVVTVAGPRSALERSIADELQIILWLLAGLCLLLLLVLQLAIRRALAPLDRLARGIRSLKAGEQTRLPAEGVREIDEAAAAINDLMEETRALVDANRDAAAKLAHALKTPLARMSALAGTGWGRNGREIDAAVAAMRRQIDQNLARLRRTRAHAGSRRQMTAVKPILDDLVFAFVRREAARRVAADVTCDQGFLVPVERTDLEELLGNLLDNAFRHAGSRVSITAAAPHAITIVDDGPGFPAATIQGCMGQDGQKAEPDGAGLGLPLAREIVAMTGGLITIANGAAGGAIVRLEWPP